MNMFSAAVESSPYRITNAMGHSIAPPGTGFVPVESGLADRASTIRWNQ